MSSTTTLKPRHFDSHPPEYILDEVYDELVESDEIAFELTSGVYIEPQEAGHCATCLLGMLALHHMLATNMTLPTNRWDILQADVVTMLGLNRVWAEGLDNGYELTLPDDADRIDDGDYREAWQTGRDFRLRHYPVTD